MQVLINNGFPLVWIDQAVVLATQDLAELVDESDDPTEVVRQIPESSSRVYGGWIQMTARWRGPDEDSPCDTVENSNAERKREIAYRLECRDPRQLDQVRAYNLADADEYCVEDTHWKTCFVSREADSSRWANTKKGIVSSVRRVARFLDASLNDSTGRGSRTHLSAS